MAAWNWVKTHGAVSKTMLSVSEQVLGLSLLAFLAACAPAAPRPSEAAPPHAVQNQRLKTLMREFNALMFEQLYTALELQEERRRKSSRIAEAATELAGAAEQLPLFIAELSLNGEERAAFLGHAQALRSQADVLREAALQGDGAAIGVAIEELGDACIGCHRLFRKGSPDLGVPR